MIMLFLSPDDGSNGFLPDEGVSPASCAFIYSGQQWRID
jgi:hypothetical protein